MSVSLMLIALGVLIIARLPERGGYEAPKTCNGQHPRINCAGCKCGGYRRVPVTRAPRSVT
jgi:hypothetical protein